MPRPGKAKPAKRPKSAEPRAANPRAEGGGRGGGSDLLFACAVAAIAFAAFLPALRADFVWDDEAITRNEVLESEGGLWRIWAHPSHNLTEEHYWPIVYTSFWIERRLWGINALGYHLVNMLLHAANAALVGALLARLRAPGAWAAAAIFAAHPVHVESVAWAIERKDVLSGFFYLAAFGAFLEFDRRRGGPRAKAFYAASIACFVLAMWSKSVAISLPLALGLYIWAAPRANDDNKPAGTDAWPPWAPLLPFFILAAALGALDLAIVRSRETEIGVADYGPRGLERILVASRALWFYLGKLLWPCAQSAIYPKWDLDSRGAAFAFPLALAACATIMGFMLRRRRAFLACLLFFIFTLGPTLGLIDFSYMQHSFVADRFQYLASIGPVSLFAACGALACHRLSLPAWARGVTLAALLLGLGSATWEQCAAYRNIETLFARTTSLNPKAWAAHYNLGNHLMQQKDFEGAMERFQRTVELNPRHASALLNWGNALASEQRFGEAIQMYRRSMQIAPNHPRVHNNLGLARLATANFDAAIESFQQALALDPRYEAARKNLANAQGLRDKERAKKAGAQAP